MLKIVADSVRAVTPHLLGTEEIDELPAADPHASVKLLDEWQKKGIPEYTFLVVLIYLALNLLALLTRGRLFPRLDYVSQAALMKRLFESRSKVAVYMCFMMSTSVVIAYYSRIDVQVLLGFDIPALRDEAERRRVTRDGAQLPAKDPVATAAGSSGEEAEE